MMAVEPRPRLLSHMSCNPLSGLGRDETHGHDRRPTLHALDVDVLLLCQIRASKARAEPSVSNACSPFLKSFRLTALSLAEISYPSPTSSTSSSWCRSRCVCTPACTHPRAYCGDVSRMHFLHSLTVAGGAVVGERRATARGTRHDAQLTHALVLDFQIVRR
jgi:hypothetical protein